MTILIRIDIVRICRWVRNLLYVPIVSSVGLFLGWLEMYAVVIVAELEGLLLGVRRIAVVEMMRRCRVMNVAIDLYLTNLLMHKMAYCC